MGIREEAWTVASIAGCVARHGIISASELIQADARGERRCIWKKKRKKKKLEKEVGLPSFLAGERPFAPSLSLPLSFSYPRRNRMPKQIDVFAALVSDVNNSVASRKLGGLAEINYCFSLASVRSVLTTFRFSCKIFRVVAGASCCYYLYGVFRMNLIISPS